MARTQQTKKKANANADLKKTTKTVETKKKVIAKTAAKTEENGEKKAPLDPAERFNRECYQGKKCTRKACLFQHNNEEPTKLEKPKKEKKEQPKKKEKADKPKAANKAKEVKGNKKPAPLMRGTGPKRGGGMRGMRGGNMGRMFGGMGQMRGGMGPMGGGMGGMGGMGDMGGMQSAKLRKMEMMKQELESMMMSLKGSGGGMGGGYGGGYGGSMGGPWKSGAGPIGYGGGYGY